MMIRDERQKVGLKKLLRVVVVAGPLLVIAHTLAAEERNVIVSVPGIPGPYCAYGVEKRLFELAGVRRVDLLWEKEQIRVSIKDDKTVTSEQILAAFEKSEYPYDYKILGQ